MFLDKNNNKTSLFHELDINQAKINQFQAAVVFGKNDIHSAEDEVKEIIRKFNDKIKILSVLEKDSYHFIDSLHTLGVNEISFDFQPEKVLEHLKIFEQSIKEKDVVVDLPNKKQSYTIDFYENKGTFIIDMSGTLKKEKIIPLKLMFTSYLKEKINSLKGVVYIVSNIDERSLNFVNIWPLFNFWKELQFDFKKIYYLSNSKKAINIIDKFFSKYGIQKVENFIEVLKKIYPELTKKPETDLFELSSQILQSPTKK